MTGRWLAALGGWAWLVPAALAAQAPTRAAGVVLRQSGADAVPVPNVMVVLHRVGRAIQGPIDSVRSGADGGFAFSFPADSTANYLLSARYAEVAYFSPPLATNPAAPDTAIKLVVFDTSSTIRLRTRSRTLVMSQPDALGIRTVIDWLIVSNPLDRTRVSRDSLDPTWSAPLPAGVINHQVGDARVNQFSPEAVRFEDDSVRVFAALSPGDKELLIQYEVPSGTRRIEVPVGRTDSVDLFLEESDAKVEPPEGWKISAQKFEGRQFRRYSRAGPLTGPLTVRFPGLAIAPGALLPWLVGAFGLALLLLSWRFLARPEPAANPIPPSTDPDRLAGQVALLDHRYRGKEAETGPEEWAEYRSRREQLIASLEAALGRRSQG